MSTIAQAGPGNGTVSVVAEGQGPWRLTWRRLSGDRLSLAAACALGVILFASFAGGPIASAALGHTGSDLFPYAVNDLLKPAGPWTTVPAVHEATLDADGNVVRPPGGTATTTLVLGADSSLGRDELLRLLDGGRTSIEIGFGGVLVALLIGVPLGCVAGFFGGWADAAVSRLTETVMAFPLILFLVFASVRLSSALTPIGLGGVVPDGVFGVALLIGIFTSFYPTRLVRAQVLALSHAEFVEGARMVGASNLRILRKHLLPHLTPTLLVWGAVAFGTNILLEVGISFVGLGVRPSTPSWGSMLSTTWGTIYSPQSYNAETFTPWLTLFPTLAILLTVVSLNQLSEGFRHALEPWSTR